MSFNKKFSDMGIKSDMEIQLPHGNSSFNAEELINYMKANKWEYITIGAQQVSLDEHTKRSSLDFWLRSHQTERKNTKQAVTAVINQLVETGKFRKDRSACRETSRTCNSLVLDK